jgi:GTP-binding protein Era
MHKNSDNLETQCGYAAIVGRPNVGKSTLLNKLIAEKISITSRKPQTTRHRILGIKTVVSFQILYVDTPGIHGGEKQLLNRYMNKEALNAISDVDVIVFVIDAFSWREEDEFVLNKIRNVSKPVILAINKVDEVHPKEKLLTYLEKLNVKMDFFAMIPISAKKGTNLQILEKTIVKLLPQNPFLYPAEDITDRSDRFLAAEIIREKLIRHLGKELPYSTSVIVEKFKENDNLFNISAIIFVEREGQKAIVIGEKGEALKKISTAARKEMERLFAKKVFLTVWVKVKSSWSDDEKLLAQLGYV